MFLTLVPLAYRVKLIAELHRCVGVRTRSSVPMAKRSAKLPSRQPSVQRKNTLNCTHKHKKEKKKLIDFDEEVAIP